MLPRIVSHYSLSYFWFLNPRARVCNIKKGSTAWQFSQGKLSARLKSNGSRPESQAGQQGVPGCPAGFIIVSSKSVYFTYLTGRFSTYFYRGWNNPFTLRTSRTSQWRIWIWSSRACPALPRDEWSKRFAVGVNERERGKEKPLLLVLLLKIYVYCVRHVNLQYAMSFLEF